MTIRGFYWYVPLGRTWAVEGQVDIGPVFAAARGPGPTGLSRVCDGLRPRLAQAYVSRSSCREASRRVPVGFTCSCSRGGPQDRAPGCRRRRWGTRCFLALLLALFRFRRHRSVS